jgi:DNA-binding transcriptional ArsR family regulator
MANLSVFEALSDPTRRKIFEHLRQGPCTVGELVSVAMVSQPAVSQHLQVLKEANLVRVEKRGQQRIYSLNHDGLSELRSYVESFWDAALDAFQQAADAQAREEQHNG